MTRRRTRRRRGPGSLFTSQPRPRLLARAATPATTLASAPATTLASAPATTPAPAPATTLASALAPTPAPAPATTLALALAASLLTGCGAATGPGGADTDRTLTVFAAASLAGPFEELAQRFEDEHDVQVRLNLAGSSDLATQVLNGAPADVLAAADEATMERVAEAGLTADEPRTFATNTLTVATPPGNPAGIERLADLAGPDVAVVVCAPAVPCGAASAAVAQEAGVELDPVSEEQSVTDVLGKVTSGEADAGLVYVTDVVRAGDAVGSVDVPEAAAVVNRYPIATVADGGQATLAETFVDLVLDEVGQDVLQDAGFGAP